MLDITWRDTERLIITLEWDWPCDLDLSATTTVSDLIGSEQCIYHGDMGALTTKPFIRLEGDADEGSRKKFRSEQITITKLYPSEVIGIAFWDHNAVMEGREAEICSKGIDYKLKIVDEYNRAVEIGGGKGERRGNGRLLCQIEKHVDAGVRIRETGRNIWLRKELMPVEQISQEMREAGRATQ